MEIQGSSYRIAKHSTAQDATLTMTIIIAKNVSIKHYMIRNSRIIWRLPYLSYPIKSTRKYSTSLTVGTSALTDVQLVGTVP